MTADPRAAKREERAVDRPLYFGRCECCWELKREVVPACHMMEWDEALCSDCMASACQANDEREAPQ